MPLINSTETGLIPTTGRKNGRMGVQGHLALEKILPEVELSAEHVLNKKEAFGRDAPLYLEIGFGSGTSLLERAVNSPESDFIGIEMFRPGIAKLMRSIVGGTGEIAVKNIRIYNDDARSVLIQSIPDYSLDGVYILFPDPWPKTRHFKRRLINPEFTRILSSRLKRNAQVVVATDHEVYAYWIERSFDDAGFTGYDHDASGVCNTAYASRALQMNRKVWAYRFVSRQADSSGREGVL